MSRKKKIQSQECNLYDTYDEFSIEAVRESDEKEVIHSLMHDRYPKNWQCNEDDFSY